MRTIFLVYSDILKSTKTVAQAEQLESEIDSLLNSLFHEGRKDFEKALNSINYEVAEVIRNEFLNKDPDVKNKEVIREFLNQLKDNVQNLRTIKLSLAFSPSQDSIDKIHDWIIENIGDGYILDLQVDSTIIGGARIFFQGKYSDSSLKKTLDQVFKTKRQEITGPLSKT